MTVHPWQTDRQTDELHVEITTKGLAHARPNYSSVVQFTGIYEPFSKFHCNIRYLPGSWLFSMLGTQYMYIPVYIGVHWSAHLYMGVHGSTWGYTGYVHRCKWGYMYIPMHTSVHVPPCICTGVHWGTQVYMVMHGSTRGCMHCVWNCMCWNYSLRTCSRKISSDMHLHVY